MKILFVSENYYPQTSGVPVVVRYLAEGLAAHGNSVAVATQSCGNPVKEEKLNGVTIYRYDIYNNILKRACGKTKSFVEFIIGFCADVVIIECTQCITTDLLLPHLNKIPGRKFFHVHGVSGLAPGRKWFSLKSDFLHTIGNTYNHLLGKIYFEYTLKRALPFFDATICLSDVDDGIDYLKKYCHKNFILDNAADNMFFDEDYCKKNVLQHYVRLENKRFMISCANYSYIKNQLGIIEQYYLSESSKEISLVCIGTQANDYYSSCKQLVADLEAKIGHRDVHLLYGIERCDIPAILNKAYLYIVGSRREQYSISIIEAMAQGVPFISTNVGNSRTLPGGITVDKIEDLYKSIDEIAQNAEMHAHYSEAGRKFAFEKCRIKKAVEKLETIITGE